MSRKMKILVVVGGFPPALRCGGPAVSLDNLCHALKDELDCSVVTNDRDLNSPERLPNIEEGWNDCDGVRVLYLRKDEVNLFRFQEITREVAPDVIYLNSLFEARFTAPFLKIGHNLSIPILLAPRGELLPNAFQKKYKKIPYLFFLKPYLKGIFFHATNDDEKEAIQKVIGIEDRNIFRISEIPTFPRKEYFRDAKEGGKLHCIFLARIHPIKNLIGAIEALRNLRGEISFDIYGPIEVPAYWDECRDAIKTLPPNVHAQYRGIVGRDAIHETFSRYDVLLFPTLSENYGHVIPEAMLSSCPVVISDRTPWTDVHDAKAGWALPLSDMHAFTAALQIIADMGSTEYQLLTGRARHYIASKLQIHETVCDYVNAFTALSKRTT